MSILQSAYSPGVTEDNLKEEIIGLFAPSDETVLAEKDVDARISAVILAFLRAQKVSSDMDNAELTSCFRNSEIPGWPSGVDPYLDFLIGDVVTHSVHMSSPRCMGNMVCTPPYFVRPLTKLMLAMNQNLVKEEASKALAPYERQALAMMHRLVFGFSDDFYGQHIQDRESTLGILLSGGTLANLTALWSARNASLGPSEGFEGIEKEGWQAALHHHGFKGAVIIGSKLMHYSVDKAADLLGIGSRNVINLPVDEKNRVQLRALSKALLECRARNQHVIAVVGLAGGTDFGSVDPLAEMAELAAEYQTCFHVDAAWGGPLLFSDRHRAKLAGIELADSVTIDGHKQMFLPIGMGVLILRDPRRANAIQKQAPYTIRADSSDLGKRALEGSRAGTALLLHAALQIIGKRGYEFLIDEAIRKARYMADAIRARANFELLAEPETNIVVYRYLPGGWVQKAARGELTDSDNRVIDLINKRLQDAQWRAGNTFVARTTVELISRNRQVTLIALRAVVGNPLTTEDDIDEVLADQMRIAEGWNISDGDVAEALSAPTSD